MFLVDASWQPAPGALAVLAAHRRPPLHDRGRRVQPRAQPRPAGVHRRLPQPRCEAQLDELLGRRPAPCAERRRAAASCSPASCRRSARATCRIDNMVPEPAVPGPQRRAHEPARRGLRAAHQGHRRAARAPGLGDGRGVQRQLPGPPAGHARRVRQPLQRRPGCSPARCSPAPRTRRCCSASGCGPRRGSPCSSSRSTPAGPATTCASAAPRVTFGDGWVSSSVAELYQEDITRFRPVLAPDEYDDPFGRAGRRAGPDASPPCACTPARCGAGTGPATASRPTAMRRTCASRTGCCRPGRARRRGRQRRAVARADAGARRRATPRSAGTMPFEQARAQLRRRRPPGPRRPADLARRRGAHRPSRSRSTSCCRWPPRASTRSGVDRRRPRPLPRRDRAPGAVRAHRVAVGPRVARRDAQPGHGRAAAQQPDGGDGRRASGAARRSPSGRRRASTRAASGGTTSSPSSS